MDENIIKKYINNIASENEINDVRKYLLEDFEKCFDIIEQMRNKAMFELNIQDKIIESLIGNYKDTCPIGNMLVSNPAFAIDKIQKNNMRTILTKLYLEIRNAE